MIFLKASLHSGDSPGLLEPADTLATPDLPAAAAVNNIQQWTVVTAQRDGVSQGSEGFSVLQCCSATVLVIRGDLSESQCWRRRDIAGLT